MVIVTGIKDKNGTNVLTGHRVRMHFFYEALGRNYGVVEAEKEVEGIVRVWYKYKGKHRFHVVTDNGEKYPFRLMQEPEEEIEVLYEW